MVCGVMVARVCMSPCAVSWICCEVESLWLFMRMVTVFVFSLAAILAQWIASTVLL